MVTRELATLHLNVEYSPEETTPAAIAAALDILLSNALSTECVLDACGGVIVHSFEAEPAYCCYVVAEPRNGPMWVTKFVSERGGKYDERLFNRALRYLEVASGFDWDRDSATGVDPFDVADLDEWEDENTDAWDVDD